MNPPTDFRLRVLAETGKQFASFAAHMLRRARPMLRGPFGELTVVFVNDRRMIELHQQFMNLPTTTDVLTFPLDEDSRGRALSGEVYVCIPEARRQAKAHGVAVEHEVLLYALHGMLHLCGFDDRTEPEYRRMHEREDAILTRLGVGRVFDRPSNRGSSKSRASRGRAAGLPLPRSKARPRGGKHE